MEKYEFPPKIHCIYNVKKLIFGIGSVKMVTEEANRLTGKKASVFLVTDKGVIKARLVDTVKEPLEKNEFRLEVFDDVFGEPTFKSMEEAVYAIRNAKYDLVIGLGGGSVMDTAKTAAALATNPGDVSYYYAMMEDRIKRKPLPLMLIPTTSGTGSETSPYAIAVDEEKCTKAFIASPSILPEVAIVDPLMSMTCPPKQTSSSGMDALSHALECFLVKKPTPLSDAYALHAVKLISDNIRKAFYSGDDLDARYNMSLAATLGGMCMQLIPCNIGHCIAEALGPMYGIPHGVICGLVTPYQMMYNFPACIERVATLAYYLGEDVHGLPTREAGLKAIKAVLRLIRDLELPTSLEELNVPKDDLPKLTKHLVEERQFQYDLPTWNPRRLTHENISELLENMWKGKLQNS
jgi:alcohol dehydrogenase class IV